MYAKRPSLPSPEELANRDGSPTKDAAKRVPTDKLIAIFVAITKHTKQELARPHFLIPKS